MQEIDCTVCHCCDVKMQTEEGDCYGGQWNGHAYCEDCYDNIRIEENDRHQDYDDDLIDGVGFADPGGNSALRAETAWNPRDLPCPTCGSPNRLTRLDRARGYQCDSCADRAEMGFDY